MQISPHSRHAYTDAMRYLALICFASFSGACQLVISQLTLSVIQLTLYTVVIQLTQYNTI